MAAKSALFKTLRTGVAARLIRTTVIFSLAVSCIAVAVQVYIDYRRELSALDEQIEAIRSGQLESVVSSIWKFDLDIVKLDIDALLFNPYVDRVEVVLSGGTSLSAGDAVDDEALLHEFPLIYRADERDEVVGSMILSTAMSPIYARLSAKAWTIFGNIGFWVFLTSAFLFWVFQSLVTRHLLALAEYAKRVTADLYTLPLSLDRPKTKKNREDEFDEVVSAINDLRDQLTNTIAEVQESERRFRRIFENSEVSIWYEDMSALDRALAELRNEGVIDLRTYLSENPSLIAAFAKMVKVLYVNPATLVLFKATAEDDFYNDIQNAFGPGSQRVFVEELCAIWEGRKAFRSEATLMTYEGEPIDVIISFLIPETASDFQSVPVSFVDISDRKQAERARHMALADAERANQAKSEFLATMSHEFRTPLNAILGFSEMIRAQYFGPLGSDSYREYADDIHDSGEHMLALINDLLDISAIEAGKRVFNKEPLELDALLENCVKKIESGAKGAGVDVAMVLRKPGLIIQGDRRSITQIIYNLLSNAVKFTPEGGSVRVTTSQNDVVTELVVEDTGIGIPEDKLATITEPFSQLNSDPHLAQHGTGLGLSIVKSLVEAHGGDLEITSVVDKGTRVIVRLPNPRS